ncbi:MAG TPA: 3-oxoacyl-ACP synthase [Cryomorphaceae bacterium]|nr:3-oxoacyl-ACP synthase [Cryomorphaceae bacterium]HCY25051.1 3-oxoacyl-ACP synthase [Cryomorphaceae bacterium]|tara:strand:+ start:11766 stop:12770 length:1005 start_codon:yes stop_codon:yes gene_type:complete
MKTRMKAAITAIGGYVPEYVLTNAELADMVDTNDEWITSRTGIKERRILKPEEGKGASYLAIKAVEAMKAEYGITTEDIDLVILASVTPDMPVAITSAFIAQEIGAKHAFAFDLQAACSSFLYAVSSAAAYIESGKYKKVLVVGSDVMSSITDYEDRTTCILFGDGCGVALMEPSEEGYGIQDEILRTDAQGRDFLRIEAGGSFLPPSHETIDNKQHAIRQEGKSVFRFAVSNMADTSAEILEKNNMTGDDVAYLVPHQANLRIIDATARRMELTPEKVLINIEKYGNTTSATIPLCLWDNRHKFNKGDNLIFAAFGGGFTWGAMWVTWAIDKK